MKTKILGKISDEVHSMIIKEAGIMNLTVDQFLLVLMQNWKIKNYELGKPKN